MYRAISVSSGIAPSRTICRTYSPSVYSTPSITASLAFPARFYADRQNGSEFNKREKTLEDKNVREHEQKLINELAQQLQKKTEQLQQAESKYAEVTGGKDVQQQANVDAVSSHLSERILEVRKEILVEVRKLEDQMAELKYRVQRLERKLGL
eukprot:TRINITY_DN3646_c0_g1_i2.p1 TRINITY_DN3646_c0_g1~~TRINITY_DN3646_c0_g1_i2.p1  ORF type:complete len:173 (-),score=38.45 TRINITY_DN3646_c0_g1_i2:274-732(-)